MDIPKVKTNRLILRALTLDDIKPLHGILGDGDILQYFPNPDAPSPEKVKTFIKNQLSHWSKYGYGWWAVEPINWHEIIGWCGLRYLEDTDETEVAYLLGRSYWRQGLATEAARASLKFGFSKSKLDQIIALVHPENVASQKVLTKLGMHFIERCQYFDMNCLKYRINKTDIPLKG
ncbi:GNAT family N-acetyltransferase [Candidatus Neomarinimicrobiota bacterium]